MSERDIESIMQNCPECGVKLKQSHELSAGGKSSVFIWCSNPDCKSLAADLGVHGYTYTDAFKTLENAIEEESCKKSQDSR